MMQKFRDLAVWQRAMAFTVTIYGETRTWPDSERYGLTSQIRRASCSIPLNIAEGAGNSSKREFCRFLEMALRSTYEVMTVIDIAERLEFLPGASARLLSKEADEIAAMTTGLMKSAGWPRAPRAFRN
jgi:four helix bundle protein